MLTAIATGCFFLSVAVHAASATSDDGLLLRFKSGADLDDNLPYKQNTASLFCHWNGVKCIKQKVVSLVIEGIYLGGIVVPGSLNLLDKLQVLVLQNNSLTGPIPDLSQLLRLKSLFLNHNAFTSSFPSICFLCGLRMLDLSFNNLSGPLPSDLVSLSCLLHLHLEHNNFNGSIPPLNQSSLFSFNVSHNNLTGAIPRTEALLHFKESEFLPNLNLCGEIIRKECHPPPFFFTPAPPQALSASSPFSTHRRQEFNDTIARNVVWNHKKTAILVGLSTGVLLLIVAFLYVLLASNKYGDKKHPAASVASDATTGTDDVAMLQIDQQESELEDKVKKVQGMQIAGKGGNLKFCGGEEELYTLDQLLKASADLLGRGTLGTTYKAIVGNNIVVTVKRLDAIRFKGISREVLDQHLESVGCLRHPNLVPLKSYFLAGEERLVISDYYPNRSLFSLIHDSKSAIGNPLHWTSCLKIADDVAQGLSYIHQAWKMVHGNLKSSNVLFGPDFEACLSDYCLSHLMNHPPPDPDAYSIAYCSPETQGLAIQVTSKSDVFAFGVLVMELLTARLPSVIPILAPKDMAGWVRHNREAAGDDSRQEMLMKLGIACCSACPDHRPSMWQVLKHLQQIREEAGS